MDTTALDENWEAGIVRFHHIGGAIFFVINIIVCMIIVFDPDSRGKEYRKYLFTLQISSTLFDLFWDFYTPILLVHGRMLYSDSFIAQYLDILIFIAIQSFLFGGVINSYFACVYYRWTVVRPPGGRFSLSGWHRLFLFFSLQSTVCAICIVDNFVLGDARSKDEQEIPAFLEWLSTKASHLFLHETVLLYAVGTVICGWGACMFVVISAMIWQVLRELRNGMHRASRATQMYQKRAIVSLIFQGTIPSLIYVAPVLIVMLLYLITLIDGLEATANNTMITSVSATALSLITTHTIVHSIMIIACSPAYRRTICRALLFILQPCDREQTRVEPVRQISFQQQARMQFEWLTFLLAIQLVTGNPCPSNYTQGKNPAGDCFNSQIFYDFFATQYFSKTFDEAEAYCNGRDAGINPQQRGMLDVDTINTLYCNLQWTNIGLKCVGRDCKWDDGSPMTYTNFRGDGPKDDGAARCFGYDGSIPFGEWQERNCGKEDADCWICRVKARTIDCTDEETAYKGGCVSVHLTPLDRNSAEAACPGGGHLVSIHSTNENIFYANLASSAGVSGTAYIGGQFSSGELVWADETHKNYGNWAKGFPNSMFGTCVQMLLASEFGNKEPKADAHCPPIQYYTGSGIDVQIYSPNYPLSIPGNQTCEYVLATSEGTRASINFTTFDCQSSTSLSLFDGMNSNQPFATFTTALPAQSFAATSNVMKIIFSANDTTAPVGTGWEAELTGI